ncbi:MAG: hypothetical protein U0R78_00085 [Nocardioidaceae bacterium]
MNTGATHPLVDDYLARLGAESWRLLPPDQARELIEDVREHLASALSPGSTEAEVRQVLERLGPPAEVVAAAGPVAPWLAVPGTPPRSFGNVEVGALLCLVLAEIIFVIYPLAALLCLIGFVLLVVSRWWTPGEKVLGTTFLVTGFPLVFVFGLLSVGSTGDSGSCSQTVDAAGRTGETVCTHVAGNSGGSPWVFWVGAAVYLSLQVFTVWKLARAKRRAG